MTLFTPTRWLGGEKPYDFLAALLPDDIHGLSRCFVCGSAACLIETRKDPAGGIGRVSNASLGNFSPRYVTELQGHR
jgi:hypothetical protein